MFISIAVLAGCSGSFEDPTIVLDLRTLAMAATPPEQVVDIDITDLPDTPEELDELGLVDVEVTALVADPGMVRPLRWTMTACGNTDSDRCDDPERPALTFGEGVIEDPERSDFAQVPSGVFAANEAMLLLIGDAIQNDPLLGFGQIDVQVELKVWGDDAPDEAVFASKRIRFAARLPAERVANNNPTLDGFEAEVDGGDEFELRLGRCADLVSPRTMAPGERLHLDPIEPDGVREDYVVPTFDGGSRMFTETMRYQWLATDGSWSRGSSGGTRDASGALPSNDSTWTAPEVDEPTNVTLWVVQRDERLGQDWFVSCIRVVP